MRAYELWLTFQSLEANFRKSSSKIDLRYTNDN